MLDAGPVREQVRESFVADPKKALSLITGLKYGSRALAGAQRARPTPEIDHASINAEGINRRSISA
jgi:hypothetical protein